MVIAAGRDRPASAPDWIPREGSVGSRDCVVSEGSSGGIDVRDSDDSDSLRMDLSSVIGAL